jgi:hypothetical protein
VAVTALSQSRVLRAAATIVLRSDARPVVEGIPEPRITGKSSRDDTALTGSLGDRCSATKGPQGVIVSSLEGFPSLCEQRGEDDPTVSWQGCEDRGVALLVYLPRFALPGFGQEAAQPVELAVRILELAVDHSQAFDEHANMSTCGLDRPGGDRHRWFPQSRQHVAGRDASNASAFQDSGDARLTDAHRLVRGGHKLPQIKEPFGAQVLFEFEHGGKIAPQLLAEPIAEPISLGVEIVGHARPFTQFDDQRLSKSKLAEGAPIGAQRVTKHLGVTAVVLGARWREAITEAIELLGINGIDVEATLEQRFDDRAMRHFDGDVDRTWLGPGDACEPRGHFAQALASMGKIPFSKTFSATIDDADAMVLGRPVDAHEPAFQFVHSMLPLSLSNRRDLSLSLYWRSRRGLPTGPQLAATRQGTGPPQVLTKKVAGTGGSRLLLASRLGPSGLPTPGLDRTGERYRGNVVPID